MIADVCRWALLVATLAIGASCRAPSGSPAPPEAASPVRSVDAPAPAATEPHDTTRAAATEPTRTAAPAPWQPRPDDPRNPDHVLEFPEALAGFYDALGRVDDGEREVVRVVHLGASMIGMDDLTGVLRGRFQRRFGEGGAGMVLMQRYMPNYLHQWVKFHGREWDHCFIAFLCEGDGHYGLGGVTFTSTGGASTTIATREDEMRDEVSRFEVWYAAIKGGGKLSIRVDGGKATLVDTRAAALEDRYHVIDVERGRHEIEVRALGRVRAYGVVLETDGPGIVWDQFSMLGAFTRRMLAWDEQHIADQIEHRDPHLIAFTYGGNDLRRVAVGKLTGPEYVREYVSSIARVRAGKPAASCLVIGITDRAQTWTFAVTPEHMDTLVNAQREAAREAGCAFFDSYAAMGGEGSARRWRKLDPPLAAGDLKHLTHAGQEVLGGWVYDAIVAGYVRHRAVPTPSVPEG